MKFVWGITGAGDLMPEIFDVMEEVAARPGVEITAVLSNAAETVLKWYKLRDRLEGMVKRVMVEKDANTPFIVGPLQVGKYDFFLVAPVTANSAAKIAHGIGDSLITNCVAQVAKGDVTTYLLPVDQKLGTTTTTLPDGSPFTLRIRRVDFENVERIREMEGVEVLAGPGDIRGVVDKYAASPGGPA